MIVMVGPSPFTFPVLRLQHGLQLAEGDPPGHADGAVHPAVLAGHVQRRVAVAVLQRQTGALLHQALHRAGQAQVGGQMQRGLGVQRARGSIRQSIDEVNQSNQSVGGRKQNIKS